MRSSCPALSGRSTSTDWLCRHCSNSWILFSLRFIFHQENKLLRCHWNTIIILAHSGKMLKYLQLIRERRFWSWVNKVWDVSKGILVLRVSTSVLNQTRGSDPTVPDDRAVVDLLNHSAHRMEKYFSQICITNLSRNHSSTNFFSYLLFEPSVLVLVLLMCTWFQWRAKDKTQL